MEREGLTIVKTERDDTVVLHLKGKLDAITESQLGKELDKITSLSVLIDFNEVTYLSSAGLRVLLFWSKKMKARDGKFELCSLSDQVKQVMDLSNFSTFFKIHATEDAAFSSI